MPLQDERHGHPGAITVIQSPQEKTAWLTWPLPHPSIRLFLAPLLLLAGLDTPTLKAVHTNQTKPLRRLLARVGAALELRAHSSVRLRDRTQLKGRVRIGLDTPTAGELVELVVAHLVDGGRS